MTSRLGWKCEIYRFGTEVERRLWTRRWMRGWRKVGREDGGEDGGKDGRGDAVENGGKHKESMKLEHARVMSFLISWPTSYTRTKLGTRQCTTRFLTLTKVHVLGIRPPKLHSSRSSIYLIKYCCYSYDADFKTEVLIYRWIYSISNMIGSVFQFLLPQASLDSSSISLFNLILFISDLSDLSIQSL